MKHTALALLVALSAVMHPCRPSPPPDDEVPVSSPVPVDPPATVVVATSAAD